MWCILRWRKCGNRDLLSHFPRTSQSDVFCLSFDHKVILSKHYAWNRQRDAANKTKRIQAGPIVVFVFVFVVVCFWMLYEWTWLRDTPRPVRFHSFRQRDLIQQERRGPCLLIWAAVFEVEIKATGGKRGSKVQALCLVQLSLLHLYLYLHQEINSRLFHIVKFLQKEFFSPVCVCVLTTWQQSDDRCRHILPWIMFYLCLINILIYMCNTKPFCTFSAMKYKQDVDTFSSVSSTNSAWFIILKCAQPVVVYFFSFEILKAIEI